MTESAAAAGPRRHLEYPRETMYRMLRKIGEQYPDAPAYEFYGKKTSFEALLKKVDRAARAFYAAGIRQGDRVTICLPNIPQAIDCFYALNRIGAVSNMIHPLSARKEIIFYLNKSKSKYILTADLFYENVLQAVGETGHPVRILTARMQDELNPVLAAAYVLRKGKDFLRFPLKGKGELWKQFLKQGDHIPDPDEAVFDPGRTSVILYSGGTTGVAKGICLTDLNFNALAFQVLEAVQERFRPGLTILGCMPIFHGFGLGINIHTALINGLCCILMPTFDKKSYAAALIKKRPNFIAGVPTIFEALLHLPELDGQDLSFLLGMFCGGDSLSAELKRKIDQFLKDHNASIQVREGYGLTECVTASCLTPKDTYRENSIGLPFPDTDYCILRQGTDEEVPRNTEGEIALTGPTVMLGYLDDPEETAETLKRMADGRIWLLTGDLGKMDEDGYIYFHQRIKRMIVTNGYNVYPGQIENVIDSCPDVSYSCVIGVKDPRRMQRVRAYVVPREGTKKSEDEIRAEIMQALEQSIARYALPREIFFREELPKTLVGKVAYRILEEEANQEEDARQAAAEENEIPAKKQTIKTGENKSGDAGAPPSGKEKRKQKTEKRK